MFVSVSDKIRKIAGLIERDNTPSDAVIGGGKMLEECRDDTHPIVSKRQIQVEEAKITPTAPPQQRRPRKQPGHLNKWNSETKKDLMQGYMQDYRAEGKDKEVDGPNSTYKKKFRV